MKTIQQSIEDLTPHAENFCVHFYHTLFRHHPEMIEHFKSVKMRVVIQDAFKSFMFVRENLGNERMLKAHFTNLYSRQTLIYQLGSAEFAHMAEAFECALEDFYGDEWNDSFAMVWKKFLAKMAKSIEQDKRSDLSERIANITRAA